MIDEKMEPEIIKGMVYGASDPLHSSYHVSYNMLLNMLRIEDADPEKILKCSFYQFEREKNVPELVREAEALQMEAQLLVIQNESVISEYYKILKLCNTLHKEFSEIILKPQFSFPFMKPGRLVSIKKSLYPHKIALDEEVWGVVTKEPRNGGKESAVGSTDLVGEHSVELLISQDGSEKLELINFPLNEISNLSAVKLNLPKDITSDAAKKKIGDALGEIQRRFASALPLLDPIGDVGIDVAVYNDYTTRQKDLTQRLAQSSAVRLPDYNQLLLKYDEKCKLLEQSTQKMASSVESQSIVMKDDVRKMKRVLRRLGYVTEDGVLSAKGRFACELTVGDEIILTDMVFDGTFNDLATEQIVGMLSCFVFQEGPNDESETKLKPEMQAPIRMMQTVIRNYVKVCVDAKMVMDEEETVNKFNTAMVGIAYAWCKGAKFSEVIKLTEIMEGSIVRAIRRLDELLRQLAQACTSIGNRELNAKFADASTKIHRGVIFTASLLL
jgi:ATP-dependent RNA helicase DOB1